MRVRKKNRISRKRCLRTMAILMASVTILSAGSGQLVYASQTDSKVQISDEKTEEKEEKLIVYLNGESGKDKNSGESRKKAVKTFERAAELAGDYGVIRICGLVTVEDETWELPDGVAVRRAEDFEGPLVKVTGSLVLENVRMYTEDFTGDGEVEGTVEKEKVYVPKRIVIKEPKELSELPLTKCEGDGVFAWAEEDFVPSEYETECKVIFHPYDMKAVDYTEEKGWDEESETVTRIITVFVESLKPEEDEEVTEPTQTPEQEPTPTPEEPETTPEATPEPTKEPAPTPETPTPEPTQIPDKKPDQEPTPIPGVPDTTPEATPTPGVPETTPEVTPTPEVPESTPEATPTPEVPEITPAPGEDHEQIPEAPEKVLTEEKKAAAYQVQNLIDYLPTEIESYEVVEAVVDATREYAALCEEQRALLAAGTYEKLVAAQEASAVYNRQCNGVTIEGDFPWYIQFIVELKNEKEDPSVLESYNVDTFITPYDMKLWDMMHGVEYTLNGQQVKVTMPAPDGKIYTQLVVVHYMEDGSVEYITPINNHDGTISFVTSSFSPYNVAGSKIAGSKPIVGDTDKVYGGSKPGISVKPPTNKPSNKPSRPSITKPSNNQNQSSSHKKPVGTNTSDWVPRTGDEQQPWLYAGIAVGALIVLIAAVLVKRKNK